MKLTLSDMTPHEFGKWLASRCAFDRERVALWRDREADIYEQRFGTLDGWATTTPAYRQYAMRHLM